MVLKDRKKNKIKLILYFLSNFSLIMNGTQNVHLLTIEDLISQLCQDRIEKFQSLLRRRPGRGDVSE